MANPEHVKILKQGVDVWNRWRKENPSQLIDMEEAELLRGCNITLLVAMSDQEIREVAQAVACPPSRSEYVIYEELIFLANHFKNKSNRLVGVRIDNNSVTMSIN